MLKRGQKKAKRTVQRPEKSQTFFAVLLFLCHKKTSKLIISKKISLKLRLNLTWHCTGAPIFPDFSWFMKWHTLGTMVPQSAY